jgi:hypothetical protein
MFANFRFECMQFQGEFFQAIYHVLMSDHPRAVHDVYQLYATFSDAVWPMEDPILLRHLAIPQVRYALLSYLVRSYTPSSEMFIEPLIRVSLDYPTLAGLVLCRILSKNPHFGEHFLCDNMQYLHNMHLLVSARLLFLLGSSQTVRIVLAKQVAVFTFLAALIRSHPNLMAAVGKLIGKFPPSAEVAALLATGGLLQTMDEIALRTQVDLATACGLAIVHANYDRFVLPPDYEAIIPWLQAGMWPQSPFTGFAIAGLCSLCVHADAQRVMINRGVVATLQAGDVSQYQDYANVILAHCAGR